MKKIQLEYCKFILEKVSFDPQLFHKELKKALRVLVETDARELINWVKARFQGEPMLQTIDLTI